MQPSGDVSQPYASIKWPLGLIKAVHCLPKEKFVYSNMKQMEWGGGLEYYGNIHAIKGQMLESMAFMHGMDDIG